MTEIKQRNNEEKGQFDIYQDGKHAGLMTYKWDSAEKFTITHTEVDKQFGGQGLGQNLVEAGVNFAREKGVKIVPLCPFAKAVISKNPDWQDIL